VSADLAATWATPGTTGVKTIAMTSSGTVPASGEIEIWALFNGTTGPNIPARERQRADQHGLRVAEVRERGHRNHRAPCHARRAERPVDLLLLRAVLMLANRIAGTLLAIAIACVCVVITSQMFGAS
jgi:hypothetical protein